MLCNTGYNPPIGLCHPRWSHGGAKPLYAALGIGLHPVSLGESCSRQDNICQLRRLGHEDVNHDEVIKALQGLLTVVLVRVRDDGVLSVNKHCMDSIRTIFTGIVEGGDFGDSLLGINPGAIGF